MFLKCKHIGNSTARGARYYSFCLGKSKEKVIWEPGAALVSDQVHYQHRCQVELWTNSWGVWEKRKMRREKEQAFILLFLVDIIFRGSCICSEYMRYPFKIIIFKLCKWNVGENIQYGLSRSRKILFLTSFLKGKLLSEVSLTELTLPRRIAWAWVVNIYRNPLK